MASERQPYSGQTCTMEDADFVLLWIKGNGTLKSANLCRLELCHSLQNRGQWCGSHTLSPPVMWPSGSKHWGSSFSDTTQRNNEGGSSEIYLSMASTEVNITNRPSILVCFQRKPKLGEDKESLDKGCTGCESATIVFCPLPTTNKTENFLKRSRSRTKQNFLLTTNFPGFIRRIFSPENQQLLSL